MSGAGQGLVFEVDVDNKLGVKKKTQLWFAVSSEGSLCGGVGIELAEGVKMEKVEYAVSLAMKKAGSESYASPLMMEEPSENELFMYQNNRFRSGHRLSENYDVKAFLKQYLEDGFVTVEVLSRMSMNGDQVDEERSRKVKMVEDVEKVMMKEETSNFLVVCEDKQFQCHKTILSARSPVFANGIAKMKEGATGRWDVKESTPEAVKQMLMFIYTGKIHYKDVLKRPLEMLQLATFYQLDDLTAASRKILLWQMTAKNAVMTLVNMDRYKETDEEAKQQVIKFIKKNARDVVGSEDWDVFQANYGSLVKEVIEAIVN